MFADTVTNGGDMGTHYYAAEYIRDVLLPKGAVTGWCPGNYCGYPLFQFYFFLPFVLIALLSHLIPLTIAFKIRTVLGTFLLPVARAGMRLGGAPFPAPAFAALATLPFLFMEANSMWGGNIPSTLAGEFAFSLGFALTVLFMGVVHRAIERRRGYAWAGLLVAVIGMTHGYTLLWASFDLGARHDARLWRRRAYRHPRPGHPADSVLAVPAARHAPYTTSYSHVWIIRTGGRSCRRSCSRRRRGRDAAGPPRPALRRAAVPSSSGSSVGDGHRHLLHTPGVPRRRHPFPVHAKPASATPRRSVGASSRCCRAGDLAAGGASRCRSRQEAITFIRRVKWNYWLRRRGRARRSGHQQKLGRSVADPRVVYEHSPDHEALTIRVFEASFFTGR
jgi:hypothetical protein